MLLKDAACGFGYLAFAGLAAQAAGGRAGTRSPPRLPHFAAAGQAGDLPVHARRARRRSTRSTTSRCSSATTASRCRSPSRACSSPRPATCSRSPWKFRSTARAGSLGQRAVPARRHARRRPLLHQLACTAERRPRRGALRAAHRQRHLRPAEHGVVDHLRPGHREPGPARLHHHLPDRWRTAACNNYGSAFLPAVYQGTPLGNAGVPVEQARDPATSPTRRSRPRCSGAQLDLLARAEPRRTCDAAGPTRRSRAGSKSFELAFRMQTAVPEVQDLAGESRGDAQAVRPRRPGRPTTSAGSACWPAGSPSAACGSSRSRTAYQWDQHERPRRAGTRRTPARSTGRSPAC